MGYHQHQQSESSGAVAAIVAAVLIVAVLGILVVAVAGLFWDHCGHANLARETSTRCGTIWQSHRGPLTQSLLLRAYSSRRQVWRQTSNGAASSPPVID